MAVIAVWKCDRDGSMFDDKKAAEAHDKMLELAANITHLIEQEVDIPESASEQIGLLLAKHRSQLAAACKGKPEALLGIGQEQAGDNDEPDNIRALQAGSA